MDKYRRYINAFIISIVFILLGLICEWKGNVLQFPETRKIYYMLIPLFLPLMVLAHGKSIGNQDIKEYAIRIVTGTEPGRVRKIYLDYARVLAVMFIILTHACSSQMTAEAESWKISLLTVITGTTLVCNPLYVMISGALVLNQKKHESIWRFYYSRFVKVLMPGFLFYFLFMFIANRVELGSSESMLATLKIIAAGQNDLVPHFWFIYMIIGLYIITPPLRFLVNHMNDRVLAVLFLIILLAETIVSFGPIKEQIPATTFEVERWAGVYIIGYIVANRTSKSIDTIIMWIGIGCGLITGVNAFLNNPFHLSMYNCSSVAVLFSASIVIILKKCEFLLKKLPTFFVTSISLQSYTMVMLHWYVLFCITKLQFGIQPLRFGCIGGIAATLLVTFIITYILALVAENTILITLKYILDFPLSIKKLFSKET